MTSVSAVLLDGKTLLDGETVIFFDRKNRSYLVELKAGNEFHTHSGVMKHDAIIGLAEGSLVKNSRGAAFLVMRPTFSDVVFKMPRGAQVIYPKDIGLILMKANIFSGARVLEAGVGSGALSMALLRAGAVVTGYERREDFCARARANVKRFCGDEAISRYHTAIRDVYDGIDETDLDSVILDLPEPWRALPAAASALKPGGILCAYTPSVMQVSKLREHLNSMPFGLHETVEALQRSWHVVGESVRPDHRMVAHTGFLTTSRLLQR